MTLPNAFGGEGELLPMKIDVPIHWNDAAVHTGIQAFVPSPGDRIVAFEVSVPTLFNGTTPKIHIGVAGALTQYDVAIQTTAKSLATADAAVGAHANSAAVKWQAANTSLVMTDSEPVLVSVDATDNTAGSAVLSLLVLPA